MDAHQIAIADQFMDAAFGRGSWIEALRSLAEAAGSSRGQLIGIGSGNAPYFNWCNDFPEAATAQFHSDASDDLSENLRVVAGTNDGELTLRTEEDYRAATVLVPHSRYLDLAYTYDIPHGCQTNLLVGPGSLVGLALLRSERDGISTRQDQATFAALAPFVRSAVRTQLALEHNGASLIAGAMDQVRIPLLLCDGDGRVLSMTASAEAAVRDGAIRVVHGRVEGERNVDTAAMRQAIARHANAAALPLESFALGMAGPGRLPTIIDIGRIGKPGYRMSSTVMLIVRSGSRWHQTARRLLEGSYGLSPAEADVALRLASGDSRSAIADDRKASAETVRTQLKAAFSKLGVGREIELSAMLNEFLRY